MDLDDLNSKLEHNKNIEAKDNFLSNFINELQNVMKSFIKGASSINVSDNSIYVVRDINDEKLSLINIKNGEEIDISVIDLNGDSLNSKDISDNVYQMSKQDLYSLNLGSNVTLKNGKCTPYYDKIKIENPVAAAKLEDMYFCLEQEKNAIYSVTEVSEDKIYLTDTEEGGYFSIPKAAYPDFKVGDLVKNINGKYSLT